MSHIVLGGPGPAGPSRTARSTASWQPLPYMYSGVVVHPFHPLASPVNSPTATSTPAKGSRNRLSWSGLPSELKAGAEDGKGEKDNPYEIPLDIGDEFFAFEEYRCTVEEDGKGEGWYRGYISQATSLPSLWPTSLASSSKSQYPRPEPSVLIGIFPAACVVVRPSTSSDDDALAAAYAKAVSLAEQKMRGQANGGGFGDMGTLKEEEEEDSTRASEHGVLEGNGDAPQNINGLDVGVNSGDKAVVDIPGEASSSLAPRKSISRSHRPTSLVLDKRKSAPPTAGPEKEEPPLPRLTAGDSTLAGQHWPLVDEIACAVREWYNRLPTYLANREYRLFNIVMQHIDALLLGRRQLLSQTMSEDELSKIRRECVSRLVKCNVAQGLEVIVRSLEDGSVMVFDKERSLNGNNWLNGITCYVYQVQLAYIDLIPLDAILGKKLSPVSQARSLAPLAGNRFSFNSTSSHTRSAVALGDNLYHCLLDIRAFVASPCAPGETAELYFSLYNNAEQRFVTEEFCLILNHLGSPARDAESRIGRLRTLFIDLKQEDISSNTYLICKLIRNGGMKMRSDPSSAGAPQSMRRPAASRRGSGMPFSDMGTMRSRPLSYADDLTDDSFSVTSGFGGHRTETVVTHATTIATTLDGKPTFRRPLGCAVLPLPQLNSLISQNGDKNALGLEFSLPIYVAKDESTFASLHEAIIDQQVKDYGQSARAETVALSLRIFRGSASQVIREHPSLLMDVPVTARLGFPDVVQPGELRNDLYVKLWSANFFPTPTTGGGSIRMRKSALPTNHGNVQVTVEVRRSDGTTLQDVLYPGGSGELPVSQYNSLVFHNSEYPTFGELLKVSLPLGTATSECHLFVTFRSRSTRKEAFPDEGERPFAFAFLPLVEASSCIKDGPHELILYRMEQDLLPAPNLYFTAPPTAQAHNGPYVESQIAKGISPLRDRLILRTYLCSSLYTQDDTLRALFSWHGLASDLPSLVSTLRTFGFVNEEEVAKFVPAVLDSLFAILIANLGDPVFQAEVDDLVFQGLMKVFSMVADRRFTSFAAVLDVYLEHHFNFPASAFHLLRSVKAVMSQPTSKAYRSLLKIWHIFFRFIIRARDLDRTRGIGLDATSAHIEADFRRQVKGILAELNVLMSNTDKTVIGSQTLAVQHYSDILPSLMLVFQPVEIAEMVIAFADSLPHSTSNIAMYKLLLLLQVVKTLFDTSESRALLTPAIVRWIKPHLGRYGDGYQFSTEDQSSKDQRRVKWLECSRLAVTVAAWMTNKLQEWLDSPLIEEDETAKQQEQENLEYCLTLISPLLATYFELGSAETAAAVDRHRFQSNIWAATPDVFPESHPFALVSQLPPPSLLDQAQNATEDGLVSSAPFYPAYAECAVAILSLVLASPDTNLSRWLHELIDIDGPSGSADLLQKVFAFGKSVIASRAFPKQWLTLRCMSFVAILRWLQVISEIMITEIFVPPVADAATFDTTVWNGIFELVCDICGSEELALEDHTHQRRRAEWILVGDLREEASALLLKLWTAIGWSTGDNTKMNGTAPRAGGYQTRFTGLAERILGLCLSNHDQTTETAVEILYSMIYAEYALYGKFTTIENEVFAKLDILFKQKTAAAGDPAMRAYFITQLRQTFESSSSRHDQAFSTAVSRFLTEIELFIDLLLAIRDLPDTSEWATERAAATYRLMDFILRIGRQDLYIRFVHQLVAISLEVRDLIAVGLALKLHADLYDWATIDDDLLDAFASESGVSLPAQTQWARKEALYYLAVDYFAEAEAYEMALTMCQELAVQHQRWTYDVNKLAELSLHQARLWERIGESSRSKPEYFRVAFYGEAFIPLNRDKDFVYRGQPWQRYSDFCDLLQHKYPDAAIHRSKSAPSQSTIDQSGGVIWVTSVAPEPDLTRTVFKETVPANVQNYHRHNGVRRFSSTKTWSPQSQTSLGGDEGVLQWVEKTILTTAEALPSILARAEVVEVTYQHLSPVTQAIAEIHRVTRSLRQLSKPPSGFAVDVKHLGTTINGAVDSPVSGGLKLYRKTFLDPAYLSAHPGEAEQIKELRKAILDYARAIQDALLVHRGVCKDLAFHEALHSYFLRSFPDEIAQLPGTSELSRAQAYPLVTTTAPSPPQPTEGIMTNRESTSTPPSLPPKDSNSSKRASIISSASRTSSKFKLPPLRLATVPDRTSLPVTVSTASLSISPPPGILTTGSNASARSLTGLPFIAEPSADGSGSRESTPSLTGSSGLPAMSARAKSTVGSVSARSSVSADTIGMASHGKEREVVDVSGGGGMKRLKRLGSILRRQQN